MKQKIKLWAWRTLLSLTCLITASTAWAANMWILGDPAGGWAPNNGYQMTQVSGTDNQYRAVLNMENGWRFSFTSSLSSSATDWSSMAGGRLCPSTNTEISDGDYTFPGYGQNTDCSFQMVGETGSYKITINSTTRYMTICPVSYTVAGSSTGSDGVATDAILGTSWSPELTDNDMTFDGEHTWTWKRNNIELNKGSFIFKVCENHGWTNAYPSSNYVINIPEAGNYDVVITFNSNTCEVNATATKVPEVIYLFGSVGKSEAWYYSTSNPTLTTTDGVTYKGTWDVNEMPSYTARDGKYGLFLLTTGFGSNWETTVPYMIGTASTTPNDHFWVDGETNYYDKELDAIAGHTNGWSLPAGTYEFAYNRVTNKLVIKQYDGPVIYVYDYTRPYIYVKDGSGKEFNGAQPGAPILNLDEEVGGHSGLSADGDFTKDGTGKLGWYKFTVPSNDYPITFDLKHNGDNQVSTSEFVMAEGDRAFYCYWTGSETTKYASLTADDPGHLRRIVAHVRVQGTDVPKCNGVEMNGPSSFYGQMYYWMAVTTYNASFNFSIRDKEDGEHIYTAEAKSDFYIELGDNGYQKIEESELEQRLANKTGRGTIIHLQKNSNTPTNNGNYVLGIDTQVHSNGNHNTTNLGATWWGEDLTSKWKGTQSWIDNAGVIANYDNSRFIYLNDGIGGNPDVYTVTTEDGAEWYTWYSDRSTATIKFGYGNSQYGYPTYKENESTYKFFATYESAQTQQTAGELWYVWTPDFGATLSNGQSQNNGNLLDVTRTYESRAKQKAMCSTTRDGNFVYYTDIKGWGDGNVYCYVWDKNGNAITPWPGVKMTKVGYDDEGHPVYLADLSLYDVTNAGGILFNNGVKDSETTNKRQTGDLEWENGGCYDYLGLLYRIGGNTDVIENEPDDNPATVTLRGVWYSRVKGTLFAKGNNDYNNKSVNGYGYIDFARMETSAGVLQNWDYDQSNWVEIEPSESVSKEDLKGLLYKDFTLYGTKLSSVNPRFKAISISNTANAAEYTPNHFTPAHFNGTPYQQRRGDGEWYFFVEPKPNEFAVIDWAIYKVADDAFYAYANTGFDGTINIDWSYHDKFYSEQNMTTDLTEGEMELCGVNPGTLKDLTGYSGWYAIVKLKETQAVQGVPAYGANEVSPSNSTAKYTVYPILLNDDMATAIETISNDKVARTLKGTRYYNLMGVESSTPFQGVNIIVKEYTDGSRESSKVIMR